MTYHLRYPILLGTSIVLLVCVFAINLASTGKFHQQLLHNMIQKYHLKPPLTRSLAPSESVQASTCKRELENANKTMSNWADTMENMVNESRLPVSIREAIHSEANKILDMIEDFGDHIKSRPAPQLAKDLVNIRRLSNRMALDIYLNTFDMRWPQTSLAIGVTVERVQQACLDRDTIQKLESPSSPLEPLIH